MSSTGRTRGRRLPGGGTFAILFVAAAVVALFAVPLIVGRRSTQAQREIAEVLDPALLAATRISHMQALEMSAFQSYLMTGEVSYQRKYQDAVSQEKDVYRQLRRLAAGLDIEGVPEQLATLSTEMESWHLLQQPAFVDDEGREAALEEPRRRAGPLRGDPAAHPRPGESAPGRGGQGACAYGVVAAPRRVDHPGPGGAGARGHGGDRGGGSEPPRPRRGGPGSTG